MASRRASDAALMAAPAAAMAGAASAPTGAEDKDKAVNAEYHNVILDAISTITTRFPNITSARALGLTKEKRFSKNMSGHMAALTLEGYEESMQHTGSVMGACNLFALNLLGTHTPGVPMNLGSVQRLAKLKFPEPTAFKDVVQVGVLSKDFRFFDHLGAHIAVNPIEVRR